MTDLKFLSGYPESIILQVQNLIAKDKLGDLLRSRYGDAQHSVQSDKALYQYVDKIKGQYLRGSYPLSRVNYDSKINVVKHALGLHTTTARVQGNKLKSKSEIQISSIFRNAPEPFLRMIVVHELAHLKEKEHNKPFYNLCMHMEPYYLQLEFDLRLYLTHKQLSGQA